MGKKNINNFYAKKKCLSKPVSVVHKNIQSDKG